MTEDKRTLAALWRAAVAETRDTPAYLIHEGDVWKPVSWDTAARRVEELAHGLLAQGIGKGDRFAILAPSTVDWALLDFALLSIGAAVVPIYPTSSASDRSGRRRRRSRAGRSRAEPSRPCSARGWRSDRLSRSRVRAGRARAPRHASPPYPTTPASRCRLRESSRQACRASRRRRHAKERRACACPRSSPTLPPSACPIAIYGVSSNSNTPSLSGSSILI